MFQGFGKKFVNTFLHLHRSMLPGFNYLLSLRCLYNTCTLMVSNSQTSKALDSAPQSDWAAKPHLAKPVHEIFRFILWALEIQRVGRKPQKLKEQIFWGGSPLCKKETKPNTQLCCEAQEHIPPSLAPNPARVVAHESLKWKSSLLASRATGSDYTCCRASAQWDE